MASYLDNIVCNSPIAIHGKEIAQDGGVRLISNDGRFVKAVVRGVHGTYSVELSFDDNRKLESYRCDCPARGFCKHLAATLYVLDTSPTGMPSKGNYWSEFEDLLKFGVVSRREALVSRFKNEFISKDLAEALKIFMSSLSHAAEERMSSSRDLDYMNDFFAGLCVALSGHQHELSISLGSALDDAPRGIKENMIAIALDVVGLSDIAQTYYLKTEALNGRHAARLLNAVRGLDRDPSRQTAFIRSVSLYKPSVLSNSYLLSLISEYLDKKDEKAAFSIMKEAISRDLLDSRSLRASLTALNGISVDASSEIAMSILKRDENADRVYAVYRAMGAEWFQKAVDKLIDDGCFSMRPISGFCSFLVSNGDGMNSFSNLRMSDLLVAKPSLDGERRHLVSDFAKRSISEKPRLNDKKEILSAVLLLEDPRLALDILMSLGKSGAIDISTPSAQCVKRILEEDSGTSAGTIVRLGEIDVHL